MESDIFWPDMMDRWHSLPKRFRFRTAYRLGQTLHTLWDSQVSLQSVPPELTVFKSKGAYLEWHVPTSLCRRLERKASVETLRKCLVNWYGELNHPFSTQEGELILRGLLRPEGLDRELIHDLAIEIAATQRIRTHTLPRRLYRQALQMRVGDSGGIYRGYWAGDARISPALLATAVTQIERDGIAPLLKSTIKTKLQRAPLLGHDVIIKRFDLPTLRHRCQAIFRYSRGRRAWAAGKTMHDLGIPTPAALGYLEVRGRWLPIRSYVFTEFKENAFDLRAWLKEHYQQVSPSQLMWAESHIEEMLLKLYSARIYHEDTKLSNLLALPPAQASERPWSELLWIDLESIRVNRRPTRYRIIRNLVQLNGSIRDRWMNRRDRMQFVIRMARHFPWLTHSRTIRHMTRWTQRRWRRERDKRCGP